MCSVFTGGEREVVTTIQFGYLEDIFDGIAFDAPFADENGRLYPEDVIRSDPSVETGAVNPLLLMDRVKDIRDEWHLIGLSVRPLPVCIHREASA